MEIGTAKIITTPILLKSNKEGRSKPALLALLCDIGEESRILEILKGLEKQELPDISGLSSILYEEILNEINKPSSLKERLKEKEEKMW